jgi:hypothetical protein
MLHLPLVLAIVTTVSTQPVGDLGLTYTPASDSPEISAIAPRAAPFVLDKGKGPFSYTYVEVGAAKYDVDQINEKSDIYYGRASIAFLGFLYAFGEYQNQSNDFQNTDSDLIELGGGVHFNVMPTLDLFGEVGWLYNDVSSDLASLDDTNQGYEAFGGARLMALPWDGGGLELNGGIGYVDLNNRLASDDAATEWEVGARVHFLKMLSVGATYAILKDDDYVTANFRVSF